MLIQRLNTANPTATTCTTDSAASEKMAEDPVKRYAATLPMSMSKPTNKDSHIAKRASRFCCSIFSDGSCSSNAVMPSPSIYRACRTSRQVYASPRFQPQNRGTRFHLCVPCDRPELEPSDIVSHTGTKDEAPNRLSERRTVAHLPRGAVRWVTDPWTAFAHPVQRLHVELLVGLDRHKSHARPSHGLGDRLCIDVVVLVGLHERLYMLHAVLASAVLHALFTKNPTQEVGSSACFHANQANAQVSCEMQELLAEELLAHYHFTLNTQPNQVEDCLPEIDTDGVNLHGDASCVCLLYCGGSGGPSH